MNDTMETYINFYIMYWQQQEQQLGELHQIHQVQVLGHLQPLDLRIHQVVVLQVHQVHRASGRRSLV